MNRDFESEKDKTNIEPIKWCRYIVNVGYVTAALIILAHVIWYFAARSVLAIPPDVYLRNYIVLPAIGLFILTFSADMTVRSTRISLRMKEYFSLSLFIVFSFYLSLTHDIAVVLLGSFILPIFVSTIFSNVKITRWMFLLSSFAVIVLGFKIYYAGKLDSSMLMQIFTAIFMFLCSYFLAKLLIRYGHDNLTALTNSDSRERYMQEQLKLDPFTGLYNRKTFDDYLKNLMEECISADKILSLAMIDVDHFKLINDQYGHAVGDKVLLYLSQILKGIQAQNIHVFRIGGEEFAILFCDCDTQEAYHVCEDLRTRMESASLSDIDRRSVTFSCGLTSLHSKYISRESFIKAADSALYEAKNNGRNQSVIHNLLIQGINQSQDHVCST